MSSILSGVTMFWNNCKHNWEIIKATYQEPWYEDEDVGGESDYHYIPVRQGGDTTTFLLQCKNPECRKTRKVVMNGKEYEYPDSKNN